VARTAKWFAVTGFCGNDDRSVFIEAQGAREQVDAFIDAVVANPPPLAFISEKAETELPIDPYEGGFRIVASVHRPGAITLISPDIGTCADCLREMNDPADRRYQYPFITCTNCGPRLSIIRDVPYDRPLTTMASFEMCPACAAEYHNPFDRRYHAQPISCFDCGPQLWPSIPHIRELIGRGQIVAVKGIGGFTLMCDARNEQAVATLRERKRRPGKPLAVMAGSLPAAQQIAQLSEAAIRELESPQRPIILAPMAPGYDLAPSVAPGLDDVGVMLPYAPVHYLLLGPDDVFVATSANSSTLPLTYRNDDAIRDLSHIVDAFLMHDRGIFVPVEDSVLMVADGAVTPIRRSRGYAPLPVQLGDYDAAVLAVGGELKNTFALTRDGMAFLSAHIGDMGSLETQLAFEKSVDQMQRMHRRQPDLIVCDMHPGYATRAWAHREAERLGVPVLEIQHHHAHALSLHAEFGERSEDNSLEDYLVLDGTGYGTDGTIWGGELLRLGANPLEFERVWHLPGFWLPGGDSAIRQPWKSAVAVLHEYGIDPAGLPPTKAAPPDALALVQSQLETGEQVVRTTSAGRLFDAAASLLGVCHEATYEAQAAMELEALARQSELKVPERSEAHPAPNTVKDLFIDLVVGLRAGREVAELADGFHWALARICAAAVRAKTIGLTGGVFANKLFTKYLVAALAERGIATVQHRLVPCNDGGLALGQAYAGYLKLGGGNG
jgi:hydrogenase maturation protein HypF